MIGHEKKDDWGLTPEQSRALWRGLRQQARRDRLNALRALWGPAIKHPPRDLRKGWTVYDGHERDRDEEWTFWRSVRASIAIVLDLRHCQRLIDAGGPSFGVTLAYWDSVNRGSGYFYIAVELIGWRYSIFYEGESGM